MIRDYLTDETESLARKLPAVLPGGSEEHCITECRDDAIHMAWVLVEGNESVGVWR